MAQQIVIISNYSLLAAKMQLFQQIHALEASPATYSRLETHINMNNMTGIIKPYHAAASNAAQEVYLQDNYSCTKIHEKGTLPVMAAPLDSMFDFEGKNIAIKMDIKDHEILALESAKALIERNNVFLQVAIHGGYTTAIPYLISTGWKLLYHSDGDFYFQRVCFGA